MEKREFQKILAISLDIIDAGIKKGYFQEDRKEELNTKLLTIFNNGIEYDIPGTSVYGVYVPSQKKLYYNAKVYKNEQEALIYILHEMKHGLDHFSNSIGFQQNYDDKNVGSNEGATQRFATDIAEEILGVKIPETPQTSLGITLQTNLDEYQIEDKINELLCKALGISRATFLSAQNEENQEKFNTIVEKFNKYADFSGFQQALDGIYAIQEETWFDENGNLLETETKPTVEQTQRAIELIKICQNQIFQYVQKTNPSKLAEIKEEFIMPMNEYGEIVRNTNDSPDENTNQIINENMTDTEMLYQEDYLKYQEFLMNGIDLGDNELVFISGLGGTSFEFDFEIYPTIKNLLTNSEEPLTEKIYVRSGDTYKVAAISFDINGTIKLGNFEDIYSLEDILEHIESSEGIGNAPEYIRILQLQGKNDKAQDIQSKLEYYEQNKSRIEEIRQTFGQKNSKLSEIEILMRQMASGDIQSESIDLDIINSDDILKVKQDGTVILQEDLKETAEDPKSIEARKKVFEDLTRAQSNDLEKENQNEQGE